MTCHYCGDVKACLHNPDAVVSRVARVWSKDHGWVETRYIPLTETRRKTAGATRHDVTLDDVFGPSGDSGAGSTGNTNPLRRRAP